MRKKEFIPMNLQLFAEAPAGGDGDTSTPETDGKLGEGLPITEITILWIGKEPSYLDDGSVDSSSANYKVAAYPLDGMQSLHITGKLIAQSVVEGMELETGSTTEELDQERDSDLEDW